MKALFRKNVLSQYLRTRCDKQLRLSLYRPKELEAQGWPVPLEARPAVQILRDRGKEWEQAKMQDLESAFGARLRGTKDKGRFTTMALADVLSASPPSPTIAVQVRFSHDDLRPSFLSNIGMTAPELAIVPPFGAFEPDIVLVRTPFDEEPEIMPDGDVAPIQPGERRQALVVADIKHAGEANASYSAEVALYAVLLANWLRLNRLQDRFFVADRLGLWTRAKEISALSQLIADQPGAALSERMQAFIRDLEPVDFPVFFQSVRHFFRQDLPRVLAVQDWQDLDWHVDSRCSSCDFLGHRNWLRASDRATLETNRSHYCVTAAEDSHHLSRLATITRGGRRTLVQAGHADVTAVSTVTPTDAVFSMHNGLKADRNHLPFRASALLTGAAGVAPNTTTVDFPKFADLQIFLTVNFDPGTGLLCALGSEARFRQRVPYGQTSDVKKTWPAEAQTLLTPTLTEERTVLISFLSRLAEVFTFVHDKAADKGGPQADKTRVQVYFWDARQFEELTKAIGRHLNSIVLPQTEKYLRGLAWLFPPEQLLEEEEITLANAVTFMKAVVQRDLRLPVPHCLTLFNVAEAYHSDQYVPFIPGSFYRDPFSDMIPRERIYEIWSLEPLVQIGATQRARSQCIADYSDAVKKQVSALRTVVWKYAADMAGRLKFGAQQLKLGAPFNFQNMSEDGRLWYGWALLEEACDHVELRRVWSAEPEELEANYSILRLTRLLETKPDGNLVYGVEPSSRDCKFRDNASFLALQDESVPSFLDLRARDLLPAAASSGFQWNDLNRKLSGVFSAQLIAFDRSKLTAEIRLSSYQSDPAIRRALISNGAVDLSNGVSVVESGGPPMADRIKACLSAIGRPPIASAAPETYAALGHAPGQNPPRNDAITPAARVLWDAAALAVEDTGLPPQTVDAAVQAVAGADWPLNSSQRDAVMYCLSHRLSIVWGPPGTGKTTTAASLVAARILAAATLGQKLRILVTGPTYTAWEKLFAEVLDLLKKLEVSAVSAYRVYAPTHTDRAPLPAGSVPVQDVEVSDGAPFQALWSELATPNRIVLVGAVAHQCYRIAKLGADTAMAQLFDHLVIDESSQVDIGKSLYPLCLMSNTAEVALFGDHLQMPPVIATQPPRGAEWLVGSIHNYLIYRHGLARQELLENYRSAVSFVEFGKRIGYPPGLRAHSEALRLHRIATGTDQPPGWKNTQPWFAGLNEILHPDRRMVAVTYQDGRAGQANDFEADLVCSMVQDLYWEFSQLLDGEKDAAGNVKAAAHASHEPAEFWERGVGIVTPHRAQRALIVRRLRETFPDHDPRLIDAAVDTVERFQGGQRDTIIISFGVGDPDLISQEETFLLQLERTNVAISRARAKCILVISEDLAYHLPSDRETIETSRAVKTYVSEFCRETTQAEATVNGEQRQLTIRWHASA
ncbi:MAG TPA: AAA domain-containing protein [Polyangia bacterium]|nr:AAA domain-containing protein [Polyangia bacterium]